MPKRPDRANRTPSSEVFPGPDEDPASRPVEEPGTDIDTNEYDYPIEDEEIVGPEEAESSDRLFCLWYGPPGSTKTTSIARILNARPEGNLLICNAEAGLKLQALRQHGIPTNRIRIWPKPGIRPTFDSLERLVLKVGAQLDAARKAGEPMPYCAFAMDSVTELVKLMLDNVQEDAIAGQRELDRKARAQGVSPPRRNQRARFRTERDDYGLVANQMRSIVRKLRYMDLDFLITALVRRDEDTDTGTVMYGPAAPPALQSDLLGYADIVIRTERRANESGIEEIVGYTVPDENHHGKDRYGLLPAELLVPTADLVLEHITGGVVVNSADHTESEEAIEVAEPVEEPAKGTARKGRGKTAATPKGSGRVDADSMSAVGAGDGSMDEPPF